ncbi:sensor protein FixL [bacterium BMS3Bbin06]|nr:sensor protein FixL [bacterium BMS3Abin08]GBE33869.1 sensor protein FixL [bacterium BMS3Bbin06]HDO34887.1 response regulator [Nitrospirota bacterium]HDY71150.1 response regulator [Nitrospirota bacterium]
MGKVLLIDDSIEQHALVKKAFQRYEPSVEVYTVGSPSEGYKVLEKEDIDVIFVDYALTGKNGIQFLKELNRGCVNVPAVIITAHGDERKAVEAMKAGAYDYVIKDIGYFNALPQVYRKVREEFLAGMELKRIHKKINDFNERLLMMNSIVKEINRSLDEKETMNRVLCRGIKLLSADAGILMVVDGERDIVTAVTEGIDVREFKSLYFDVARTTLVRQNDGHSCLWEGLKDEDIRVVVAVPVDIMTNKRGVLQIMFRDEVELEESDISTLEIFADTSSSALRNSMLFQMVSYSQQLWQDTFDAISDILFVVDERGKVHKCNTAFADACGIHPKGIVGKDIKDVSAESGLLNLYLREELMNRRESFIEELSYRDRTYLVSGFPTVLPGGIGAMVNIFKDITEMNRLRAQLYHADKLSSLGLLVSGVAHEINNPLTGIIGYTELLQLKTDDGMLKKELQKIADAAERCRRIVENLLAFSRQKPPEMAYAQVNDIIDSAVELRIYWLRSNNIDVIREFSELPLALIDPQQIQQVILNILVNAEHAIEEVDKPGKFIRFCTGYDKEKGRILISVADNGIGIPGDVIPRIFDPFFTTKPVNKGSGLGLSISHGIVKKNGGNLWVESTLGEGTAFYIELPLARKPSKDSVHPCTRPVSE